jgi:ketosteroid isomerase-like protein
MSLPDDLREAIERHQNAINSLINGDAQPYLEHCSHRDDVSVAGGWGAYERGWDEVRRRYEWVTDNFAGTSSNICSFENITVVYGEDIAYTLDIERNSIDGNKRQMDLRVTTVFRKEAGEWKMVHRHGDPLVEQQYGNPTELGKA